jgi:hypothetical protein
MSESDTVWDRIEVAKLRAHIESLMEALMKEQRETAMLREIAAQAAWYMDRYGDHRKDASILRRFLAASKGEPEPVPEDDE